MQDPLESIRQFFGEFNGGYQAFLTDLQMSFNQVKELKLHLHLKVVNRALAADADTRKVFELIKENVAKVFSDVHLKNEKIFTRGYFKNAKGEPLRIAWFECASLYEIWPRLRQEERVETWASLSGLVQNLAILTGTGSEGNLNRFATLAQKFIQANPGIDERSVHAKVMDNMFTNPEIAEDMRQLMQFGDVSEFGSSFGSMMRGLGAGLPDTAEETEQPPVAVHVPSMYPEEDAAATAAALLDPMSSEFERLEQKTKERETEAKSVLPSMSGGISQMLDKLENEPLDKTKLEQLRQTAASVLGPGADKEKSEKMRKLFGLMVNKAPEASVRDLLCTEFGATPDDLSEIAKYQQGVGSLQNLTQKLGAKMTAAAT